MYTASVINILSKLCLCDRCQPKYQIKSYNFLSTAFYISGKEFRAVFISTVRTKNLLTKPFNRRGNNNAECDGDIGDFGFLSDKKLLNTALTRAQSLVAVVGDPVALGAIGDCVLIWRAFLKHCTKLNSIHPQEITVDSIRMQVISLLSSSLGKNLIKIMSAQRGQPIDCADEADDAFPCAADYRDAAVADDNEVVTLDYSGADEETARAIIEDWNLDYRIEADDIIKQLAKDEIKHQPPTGQKAPLPSSGEQLSLNLAYVLPVMTNE